MQNSKASFRTIWVKEGDDATIEIIDQRQLPHQFVIRRLCTVEDAAKAIEDMAVRGAPLIGITAAYGIYLAALKAPKEDAEFEKAMNTAAGRLLATRPTAVNLQWALHKMRTGLINIPIEQKTSAALSIANDMAEKDVAACKQIGINGLSLIEEIASRKQSKPVEILTHCNAGWLGCVEWGTATSPIYMAAEKEVPIHVWVDETRPRNQGFNLTAWELNERKIPHTVIVDNAGGHLMQHGQVDMVIVGADRVTREGDVANKIGTYLKALAAADNYIPFYVALPAATIDWNMRNGIAEIPIEERDPNEVKWIQGWNNGQWQAVQLAPDDSPAANYGFDVTPARLITAFITERGICPATETGLLDLFPEKNK